MEYQVQREGCWGLPSWALSPLDVPTPHNFITSVFFYIFLLLCYSDVLCRRVNGFHNIPYSSVARLDVRPPDSWAQPHILFFDIFVLLCNSAMWWPNCRRVKNSHYISFSLVARTSGCCSLLSWDLRPPDAPIPTHQLITFTFRLPWREAMLTEHYSACKVTLSIFLRMLWFFKSQRQMKYFATISATAHYWSDFWRSLDKHHLFIQTQVKIWFWALTLFQKLTLFLAYLKIKLFWLSFSESPKILTLGKQKVRTFKI